MILGQKLRARAAELGLSGSEVARRAQLDERRYGHYVRGVREPDLATLLRICKVLLTTPNDLLLDVPVDESTDSGEAPAENPGGLGESQKGFVFQPKPNGRERGLAQLMAAGQELAEEEDLVTFAVQIRAVAKLRRKKHL